jgi:hypothetical protein
MIINTSASYAGGCSAGLQLNSNSQQASYFYQLGDSGGEAGNAHALGNLFGGNVISNTSYKKYRWISRNRLGRVGAPRPNLAGMATELPIASPAVSGKPSAATRSRTAGAGNQAGDFLGESLPDGVDEPRGPVANRELRRPSVGRGDQFESAAGQFFRNSPGQVFPAPCRDTCAQLTYRL